MDCINDKGTYTGGTKCLCEGMNNTKSSIRHAMSFSNTHLNSYLKNSSISALTNLQRTAINKECNAVCMTGMKACEKTINLLKRKLKKLLRSS